MRQLITILTILVFSNICKSQNDTIYIEDNYILLNGKRMNVVENNVKNGMWIEYEITDVPFVFSMGSGDNFHVYDLIRTEYRALKPNEYYGIKYTLSSKCDTVDNVVYCDENSVEIKNKIPSKVYYISGDGKYDNNKKENLWSYFYPDKTVRKEIFYVKGLPYNSFNIYRQDRSVLMKIKRINETEWEICKYSKSGEILNCEINRIEEFKELY